MQTVTFRSYLTTFSPSPTTKKAKLVMLLFLGPIQLICQLSRTTQQSSCSQAPYLQVIKAKHDKN